MNNESMTALEFQNRFRTQEDCLAALEQLRWPNGFICPNCEHDFGYHLQGRSLIQCAVCRHQTSVTAGTIFHKTRVPLPNWFWIIYAVACDKGGASSTRLAEQLGMYQKTVWHIIQKVRHAMARRDEGIPLSGLIELDGMFVGPEARKAGRQPKLADDCGLEKRSFKGLQTQVLVMIEAEHFAAGSVSMRVVEHSYYEDVKEFGELKTDGHAWFKTDGGHSNYALRTVGAKHTAKVSSGPASVEWLPLVHRAISLAKRFLMGTYHGVSPMYLQRYLDEFCFRFNRRHKQTSIASSLLRACLFALPMSYAELKL